MLNFKNISPTTDFYSKLDKDLLVINKNVLYITHEMDKIKKVVMDIQNSMNLQKQVDEYFDDTENIPEEVPDKDGDN